MRIEIELTRPRWLRVPRTRRGRSLAAMGVTALVVAVPVAWAGHDFADVPTGAIFHDEIAAIKRAGITTGCGGPNYCPTEFVRRDAMAAFMHRGYGRVAHSTTPLRTTIVNTDSNVDVGAVTIRVPGAGTGTQFVRVEGSVVLSGTNLACPCNVGFGLAEIPGSLGATRQYDQVDGPGFGQRTLRVSHVFSAEPGPRTFYMSLSTASTVEQALTDLSLTATTFPFGANGTDVLAPSAEPDGGLNTP